MPKRKKTPSAEILLLRGSVRSSKSADRDCEQAHMDLMRVYWLAKAVVPQSDATAEVIRRIDAATDALSDCRQLLGDAVHQVESLLK